MIHVEKIDRVSLNVFNLDEAVKFWSDALGLVFPPHSHSPRGKPVHTYSELATDDDRGRPVAAISTIGLELMQKIPHPGWEGMRGLNLKVADIEEARDHLVSRGIRIVHEIQVDGFKEIFCHPPDMHGVRIALVEFTNPKRFETLADGPKKE